MSQARSGHIIKGPKWPEPVMLNLIEEDGDFIHIVGVTKGSGEHIDQVIRKEEFQEVVIEDDKIGFSEEAWKVFLAIETLRYRFASNEMVLESIQNKDNPLFIRRVKEDLKDFNSKPIFLPRHVKTISLNLGIYSPNEKELYNELSRYVNFQYNKALQKDKRHNIAFAFALVILQRRLASSTYALLRSLERRKERLEELIKRPLSKESISEPIVDYEVIEDMPEQERWKEEELWETISVAENIEFTVDDDYVSRVKENLGETLATRYIDYTRIKEMAQQAKEHRLIPEYTENYLKRPSQRLEVGSKKKTKVF